MVPGTVLGSYEIVSLLGAGGMGEVYRARDQRLGRDVALKLLPQALADDPERVARFQREAQLLASLNHAHIGAIYGLEQLPAARFLVLELAEGGTLAARIARGAIPLDEASGIARQIALALQAAHDKGVVHRDLKPSNVAFTTAGDVKVLDFGLAKLGDRADLPVTNASLSPTITSPALMTGVGALLGTAAYMAPEQAKGKAADKRSDVWAFGCVLYEMLTGRRAFEGDDIADTLANVLKVEPDWSLLASSLPPAITVLLRRCLAKDPRQRCGDMAAALILLEESAHLTSAAGSSPTPKPARWRRVVVPLTAVVAASLTAGATWWALRPKPLEVVRTVILATGNAAPTNEIAITPDGRQIAYVANNQTQLLLRPLDDLEARPLADGTNIRGVFASPDGRSLGYFDGSRALMKVGLRGGPATAVTQTDAASRGAAWLLDDTIVFATANPATGLLRVAASGGEVTVLTRPDAKQGELDHGNPESLPDGRAILYTIVSSTGAAPQIALLDLETGNQKVLVTGGAHARYVESGHLVYTADGILQAVPFDLATRTTRGTPVPVLRGVASLGGNLLALLDVATNGTLVYLRANATSRFPVWVDRGGREERIKGLSAQHQYLTPRLSPDNRHLAYHDITGNGEYDVWVLDLERGTTEQLTAGLGRDSEPIWSADGTRIAYLSTGQPGGPGIFVRRADGTGDGERLTEGIHLPTYWSANGKWLAYTDFGNRGISVNTVSGLMKVDIEGDRTPKALTRGSAGRIDPTERWIAFYQPGNDEIYVVPFADPSGGRSRISTDGGRNPLWSTDGKTLFYRRGQAIVAVAVSGDDPSTWKQQTLFEGQYLFDIGPTHFDVGRDGRFLMIKTATPDGNEGPTQIIVVQNWFEELRRLAPLK